MKEYARVTGLNFGVVPVMGEEEKGCPPLVRKYMKEVSPVRIQDLEAVLMEYTDKEDAFKLGLLCLIHTYLFALDGRRIVSNRLLHMVEDLNSFLQFPWGKVTFRATLKGMNKDMRHLRSVYLSKRREGKNWGTREPAYTVYGFALAFQVWTYEVIQTFVPRFAERLVVEGTNCPRILLYKSKMKNSVPEVVNALNGKVVRTMVESLEEHALFEGEDFKQTVGNSFDAYFEMDVRKRIYQVAFDIRINEADKRRKPDVSNSPKLKRSVPTATPASNESAAATRGKAADAASHSASPRRENLNANVSGLEELKQDLNELKTGLNDLKTELRIELTAMKEVIQDNQALMLNQLSTILKKFKEGDKWREEEKKRRKDMCMGCYK